MLTTPVVLVHGYGSAKSHWFLVKRALVEAGFAHVRTFGYDASTSGIPSLAADLADYVHSVRSETGSTTVHLVGHSLGGVLIRYAVSVLGIDAVVDTAVTIASPHGGSPLARLGLTETAVQLRPRSSVLREMERAAGPSRVRWIAFWSDHDVIVPAPHALIRPAALRARNIRIDHEGHVSILVSRRLAAELVTQLTATSPSVVDLLQYRRSRGVPKFTVDLTAAAGDGVSAVM